MLLQYSKLVQMLYLKNDEDETMLDFTINLMKTFYSCWAERHGGINNLCAETSFLA